MVRIPPDALTTLFPGFLQRGGVIRVEKYPRLFTGPRDKFLILLNHAFGPAIPVHHVLTTSQTDKIRRFSWADRFVVIVHAGGLPFFPLETAVNCRDVHSIEFDYLQQCYADGSLTFVGNVPEDMMSRIDGILRASPYLTPKVARDIFAAPPPSGE